MSRRDEASPGNDEKEMETATDDFLQPEDGNSRDTQLKDFLRRIRPRTLLRDDLTQFKEDVLKVFKDKDTNTTNHSTLTLLRDDLSHFRDDLSSVFRIRRDNKDESSNTCRIKAPEAERTDETLKRLFSRDRDQRAEDGQEDVLRVRGTGGTTEPDQRREAEDEAAPETLSSGIDLFSLRDASDARERLGGDEWSIKNFACYLTLDPNTANMELCLSDGNRRATRVFEDHRYPGHPERFECCPQVLCREGLLDSVYWEVVWRGGADIGVTYNNICRDGDPGTCLLGHNDRSWSLECCEGSYTPCYNNRRFKSSSPQPFARRVGVHLDWASGSLSFFCVSEDAMVHLHTFTSTFTEPLYPGFWVWAYEGSVSLCQVELDWERLLQ
ncbi:E3 ubiquitin/ISG15 ligase TRIM25-like isoform X2 [Mugil cephalus]|uniref:E3 ubiquitin/ISG15 ligase TRIM25-like isoform X2 n=1 Tax=Mugil cephalus TaxID=48193 RepID=UPI001FB7ED34|nr:E3 ubiquitin/ISG15 ligase TRIM25-like isoform X2 [Mugil cephalus]